MKTIIIILFLLFTPQMLMADGGQDDASAKFENTLNAEEAKLYKEELARLMGMCKSGEKLNKYTEITVCGTLKLILQEAVKESFVAQLNMWRIYRYGYFLDTYLEYHQVHIGGLDEVKAKYWYSRLSDNLDKQFIDEEAKLYKEELVRLMGMCKPGEEIEGTYRTVCGELELTLQKAVKGDFNEQATIWHIYKYGYFYYGSAEVDTNGQEKEREEIWYSRMSDNLSKQLGAEGFKLYKEELEYLKGVCVTPDYSDAGLDSLEFGGDIEQTLRAAVKGDFDAQRDMWRRYRYGTDMKYRKYCGVNEEKAEKWHSLMMKSLDKKLDADGSKLYEKELKHLKKSLLDKDLKKLLLGGVVDKEKELGEEFLVILQTAVEEENQYFRKAVLDKDLEKVLLGALVDKELDEEFLIILKAAVAGDAEYQYYMAQMYQIGGDVLFSYPMTRTEMLDYIGIIARGIINVTPDQEEALKWYSLAAKNGNESAQYSADRIIDNKRKLELANNGDFDMQLELANKEYSGGDYNKALEWYLKAVNNKNNQDKQKISDVEYTIATIYEPDDSAEVMDAKKAAEWFVKSGNLSDIRRVYYYGNEGADKYFSEALKLQVKEKEAGANWGTAEVVSMYYYGKGVPVNYFEAYKWCSTTQGKVQRILYGTDHRFHDDTYKEGEKAQKNNSCRLLSEDGKTELETDYGTIINLLKSKLTPEQISEADKFAKAWNDKYWQDVAY
jgi:TPR repeat protein